MYLLQFKNLTFLTFVIFLLATPLYFAHAAVNAGVVNGVWLSNETPKEGETIRIFTAVQNQSTEQINGSVAFLVNGDIVGTKKFSVIPNDIIPVSIDHTFLGGEYDVSAYITSVENGDIAYTIASQTSISISSSQPQSAQTVVKNLLESSSTSEVLNAITKTTKNITEGINPVTQNTAERIEAFRDTLLNQTISPKDANEYAQTQEPTTKLETAKEFVKTSKTIAQAAETSLWQKIVGISLSLLALLVRLWFVFVIAIVGFAFWRLVRGQRIR
ncbi:MAG: hypothetical protein CMI56_03360 [Parcubacteria group bacterium]|nr:hypothetical protein [Parcubacteria group bacterium]|tara:strand:+ start:3074 stop:3892 length:819 start_codon:yes stop_codon:yes gene_type:complete